MSTTLRPVAGIHRARWSLPAALLVILLVAAAFTAPAGAAPVAGTVYAYAYDEGGAALEGVTVELFSQDPGANPAATPLSTAVSDDDGRYAFDLELDDESGTVLWARATKAGYETQVVGPNEVWGPSDSLDDFFLAPDATQPGNVIGSVLDRAGNAPHNTRVVAYRKNGALWDWADSVPVRTDGTFGFMELPAGVYTFQADHPQADADDPGIEPRWFGGVYDQRQARIVTVTATGQVDLGRLTVVRNGTISGRVTVPAVAGFDTLFWSAEIFDADGEPVPAGSSDSSGLFATVVTPGTYTVRFGATRYDSDDEEVSFVPQWWKGAYSSAAATRITVSEGASVTGIDATLGRTLTAVVAPRIGGTATTGRTLTATTGTWSRQASVLYAYRWRVGGVNAGVGPTYLVKAADRGKAITVTVTASHKYGTFLPGTATSGAVVAKSIAALRLTAKGAKKAAKLKVSLSLPGTATARTSGTVTILDGSKRLKVVSIKKGTATVKVKLKKGKHRLKAVYAGSAQYTPASATTSVKVK